MLWTWPAVDAAADGPAAADTAGQVVDRTKLAPMKLPSFNFK